MGRFVFHLPDIGEGVAEAEIVAWHVKPGEIVREDQALVDVMTDKATVDITAPVGGVVTAIHGDVGGMAAVGSPLVEFETADDDAAPVAAPATQGDPQAKSLVLAAPATRARARALGVALELIEGTGPNGRVTPQDLDAHLARKGAQGSAASPAPRERDGVTEVRIVGLRRKIAEKMQEAKRRIPHFGYVEELDVTELEALRQALNAETAEGGLKLTLLPFLMRGLVIALQDFPHINSRYDDEAGVLHQYDGVHIGIATQTKAGLLVPVVRHAEARDLWGCARELQRLAEAARAGTATRDELACSTITLTSLGPLGGVSATPVINHPEVAIIGPNRMIDRPVVREGRVVIRRMMNLSTAFDHRIVDGADAASFVQRLKALIEHPARLFMR